MQCLAADPVEQIRIYLGTRSLHQVEGEAVSRRSVHMKDADTRIEPACGKCKSRFRFEYGVQIVHCLVSQP
jgi:hypothetical protein